MAFSNDSLTHLRVDLWLMSMSWFIYMVSISPVAFCAQISVKQHVIIVGHIANVGITS